MPRVYEVYLERAAERDLKRLEAEGFHRIISAIKVLAENPRPVGCRKLTGSKSDWRIRVGDYRVIYEVDDEEKAVRVMRVRHRREVYR
ncbi:MAG TPA: type II toxin-antitoxin system RelE/ParE family toxin [Dehalococcoidia bacterium]|nr:type II toxin-antitoxin system RelE/ParE family toxin [Dehalococcoidia bacterium]